jgi:transmembrane sensor
MRTCAWQTFLEELSRYRRGQLQCDPQVANLLISGTYPLDDSERILDLLQISLPVKVQAVYPLLGHASKPAA